MGERKLTETCEPNIRVLSIYGYTNYRAYLKDYYEFRKDGQHGYSYRTFSKAAGFSSPNILKLVIEGQRNISADGVEKFVTGLRLKGPMAEYFRALVRMNQAKSDEEKEKFFHHVKRLTPNAKRRRLNAENLQYLSHWLYPALREMVNLDDFRFDPYWISRRLHNSATTADIVAAWNFLLAEGYIESTSDGRFAVRDHMVTSSDEVGSLAIRNYHRQMLQQAGEALSTLPMAEREFGAVTFVLPSSALEELKFKLKAFRKDLHEWAMLAAETIDHQGKSTVSDNQIIQVNIQMYPHTKKVAAK